MALVGTRCSAMVALLSSHQSIGVPQPVKLFGTEDQKKRFLPRLARGAISAFALTETDVGSDPARMATTATPTADGSAYILNGEKLWCTNGTIAELLVVMARTPGKGGALEGVAGRGAAVRGRARAVGEAGRAPRGDRPDALRHGGAHLRDGRGGRPLGAARRCREVRHPPRGRDRQALEQRRGVGDRGSGGP